MKKSSIPTLLGIIILVIGVAVGVFLLQRQQQFRLGASQSETPIDVRVSNITDSSMTVSWYTDDPTIGYLEWGDSESLGKTTASDSQSLQRVHSINLENLEPNKTYYFIINTNGSSVDNEGLPWNVKTGARLPTLPENNFVSGSVKLENGLPAAGVIVYVIPDGGQQLSTITSQKGEWIIPVSGSRNANLITAFDYQNETLLSVYVQAAENGIASAQVYFGGANPTPTITIGKTHDFRSQTQVETSNAPDADIQLPGQDVSIDSVNEGETIYTQSPEFFGSAPADAELTIEVQSELIAGVTTADSTGSWSWSPNKLLEEGVHQITISWTDENGIVQKVTQSFTVMAAEEEPAFESTPSATVKPTLPPTPSPSPSPSPTPKPTSISTPTASPSPSPSPSPTPRVSMPATDSGIPNSGIGAPTIVFAAFGSILLSIGVLLAI